MIPKIHIRICGTDIESLHVYMWEEERADISDPKFHLKTLGKEKQRRPKVSRQKETVTRRAEISGI